MNILIKKKENCYGKESKACKVAKVLGIVGLCTSVVGGVGTLVCVAAATVSIVCLDLL